MTVKEIVDLLTPSIQKACSLTPASFGKFTASRLPDDYLYNKWIGKGKDFTDVYLNMDSENQALFVGYAHGNTNDLTRKAFYLNEFFLFCWNFNSYGVENPFEGKYGKMLTKKATGKVKPDWITGMQVMRLFNSLDENGKKYLVWCAFGAK